MIEKKFKLLKNSLETIDQIAHLVHAFYEQAIADEVIGSFFNEAMETPLEKHLPIIINFWSSLILDTNIYKGNPMMKHLELNEKMKLETFHFDRWLELWEQTVDELYVGTNAETAKKKAFQIAQLMQLKIARSNQSSSLL